MAMNPLQRGFRPYGFVFWDEFALNRHALIRLQNPEIQAIQKYEFYLVASSRVLDWVEKIISVD